MSSSLRQLLDRYEDSAEADAQGLVGELVVALAREYLAGPRDPQDARDELWDTLNELSERVETLTRDHNGLVRSTARAIDETPTRGEFVQLREETARHEHLRVVREALAQAPTHDDLRQLASAVGSLATRVAELEHGARDREDTIHFLTQGLRERTEERDHARARTLVPCARLHRKTARADRPR